MTTTSPLRTNKEGQYVVKIGIRPNITKHLVTPLTSTDNIDYLGYEKDDIDEDCKFHYYSIKVSDTNKSYIQIIPKLQIVIKLGNKLHIGNLLKD